MLSGENIICVSTIDWGSVWQGHQEIMSSFARNGNRVLFVENTGIRSPTRRDLPRLMGRLSNWGRSRRGIRRELDNLSIYSPMVLPFPYSRPALWLNRRLLLAPLKRWMDSTGFHDPVIWTYLPTRTTLDIADSVRHKFLVYYCVADFPALSDNAVELRAAEEEVMRRSRLVFAQGKVLARRCGRFNGNVHVFPGGVNTAVFDGCQARPGGHLPDDIRGLSRPIIGYIGGIHKHIDFELLKEAAALRPAWTFVLVGPVQADTAGIEGFANVRLLGQRDFQDLPAYVAGFDACIIPYRITDYTRTVYPTKLNEYHAMGKPVVSTELPEVLAFNAENQGLVYAASGAEDFVRRTEEALAADDERLARKRMASAERNGWSARISGMTELLEKELARHA